MLFSTVFLHTNIQQGSLPASSVLVKYAKAHGLFLEINTTRLSGVRLDQVLEYARSEVRHNVKYSEELKTRHPWFKADLALGRFQDHYDNSVATQLLATNVPLSNTGFVNSENTVKYTDSNLPPLNKQQEYRVIVLFSNSWSMNSQLLKTRWTNCRTNAVKKGSDVACCYSCDPSKKGESTTITDVDEHTVIAIDVDVADDLEDAATMAHRRHLQSFFDCDFVGGMSMQFNSNTFLSTESIRGIQSCLRQLNDPNDLIEAFSSSRNVRYISDGLPLQKALKASLNLDEYAEISSKSSCAVEFLGRNAQAVAEQIGKHLCDEHITEVLYATSTEDRDSPDFYEESSNMSVLSPMKIHQEEDPGTYDASGVFYAAVTVYAEYYLQHFMVGKKHLFTQGQEVCTLFRKLTI